MKKIALLLVPVVLMPYVFIFALANIFLVNVPLFGWIMDTVFKGNGLLILLAVVIAVAIAIILGVIYIAVCLIRNTDALAVARVALIVKLCQIPAYAVLFVLGLMFLITIFTYAFTIVLAVLEYCLLVMTGFLSITAVILATRQRKSSLGRSFWLVFWQFFFCTDVIATAVLYFRLKRQAKLKD